MRNNKIILLRRQSRLARVTEELYFPQYLHMHTLRPRLKTHTISISKLSPDLSPDKNIAPTAAQSHIQQPKRTDHSSTKTQHSRKKFIKVYSSQGVLTHKHIHNDQAGLALIDSLRKYVDTRTKLKVNRSQEQDNFIASPPNKSVRDEKRLRGRETPIQSLLDLVPDEVEFSDYPDHRVDPLLLQKDPSLLQKTVKPRPFGHSRRRDAWHTPNKVGRNKIFVHALSSRPNPLSQ